MKRSAGPLFLAMLLALAVPTLASAQASIFLGGGATIPTGDFGDYAKTGWMGQAGVVANVGSNGLFVAGEGFYGSNKHETGGDKTNLYGADGQVGYRFGDQAKAGLYVAGLLGAMIHKYSPATGTGDSSTGILFGGIAGVDIPAGKVNVWVEGRWMNGRFSEGGDSSNTAFFGLFAGVSIPVGGSN
jgi:hypothetical protein